MAKRKRSNGIAAVVFAKVWAIACLLAIAAGGIGAQSAHAADTFRALKGPEIQRLFNELDNVWFPSDGTGSETDNWRIFFHPDGSWEGATGGSDADGTWRVEGDKQCVTIRNNVTSSASEENIIFEGCFSVLVDVANGTIAANFPSLGKKGFLLKEGAYGDIAQLKLGAPEKKTVAQTAPPKPVVDTSKAEQEEKRRALERQKRELEERARQAAEKEREAQKTNEAASRQQQLEQQRLAAEAKIKQLQMQLELERLRQQRAKAGAGGDTNPPVIQAAAKLETRAARITIQGVAKDDVSLVRVELNGRRIETRNGRFSAEAQIDLGRNNIRITAFDAQGNKTEHVVAVTRTRDVPDIAYGNYYALVIGIDDYKSLPKLKTAVADAETVAKTLEELYGYQVTRLTNPSRADIIDAFDEFRDLLTEEDNLLIYYAGHGWLDQQTGTGYWMPVNARSDRRSRWISNATLTNALQTLLAKHVMVVADSCYSGTLTRSIKVPQRNRAYLERMAEKRARVVLASGGLEPVADSGGGKHSVFAAQFLKALRSNEGVLDGTKLFETVRQNVVLNADQTPEYSDIRRAGHEGGDFLFVRKE
ncbi:MAG: hypothetical protein GKS00_25450 [Alphaproteobacteria bacterium]|nr:hypothetical protein [Alphaproteobacteria bacterium]